MQVHRRNTYILKDDGASDNFVSASYMEAIRNITGAVIEEKDVGFMRVRMADTHNPARIPKRVAKLRLRVGTYEYEAWFTIYDLADYDIVLGKRWMQHINLHHQINHKTNIMWIWDEHKDNGEVDKTLHTLKGLRPEEGRIGRKEAWVIEAAGEGIDLCFIDDVMRDKKKEWGKGTWVEVRRVEQENVSEGDASEEEIWKELGEIKEEGIRSVIAKNFVLFQPVSSLPPASRETFKITLREDPTPNHQPW
ncbi:hypothetical protein L211DRAFT_224048 [Terfezia boudieri ATCC MYA-4762]|uniref:Uncharacterized protein n=1 Tax=Terfezia boudieri ATCC MYA-4762 TaxID=1051890 RepID=A0A3N4LLN9_9PEZI|nr:hypothetical protein L211DRAFT_224048 [Terfezia boudieri ATCC MYA-4762]